ncbi:HEPN domain-containing protein [Streptomyces bacillaris]|uniref:hypothetical protein n=1 Tax=Streptomyces bacillaris TaxID=68179 RepID=UPI0037F33225
MSYLSPFGDMDTDHESPDALCLSRAHCTNAPEDTIGEFFQGSLALIDAGVPQPAFFMARQLAELSLKAFLGPRQKAIHRLGEMLDELAENGDDLFAEGDDQRLIVQFIRDLHERDPKGDEGRYPTNRSGEPSLARVCCADPRMLRENVCRLFLYTQKRLNRSDQSV